MLDGDRFVRREELAPGVWLAHDSRLGRSVVLKRVVAGEPRAQARLNHPHVVTVYEHVEGWAVLEYAPGGSLAGRELPLREAARIGAQIAGALAYMHGKGLVHCDVKPGNIVLAEDGVAKLTDFGSAYRVDPDATLTPVAQLSYTRGYAPPELMRGSPMPASDVYALAVTVRELAPESAGALSDLLSANPHDRPDAAEAHRRFQAIAGGTATTVTGGGPAQLPADVYGFAGRTAELERLTQLQASVVVISGTAGVGKTTLAVHWAHRVAEGFPDGQLYVNLRGFDPSGQVLDPADAVRGFLDALDIPPERIPADLAAQGALFRSTLSDKRMLVLLDNARDAEQVRPLLPGTNGCQVIVTSRNDLIGLVTKEGARPVTLDVLTNGEARQLLDHRIGTERTAAEPEAVEQIISSCARLPLALAIVAARAAIHPDFPLAAVTDALTSDDPDSDVRAVFSWSYRQLSEEAQRLFRLLSVHPGPDITAAATTSLFGAERPPLAELTRAHLIEERTPGRYSFHDLLRAYAAELVATDPDRQVATHRMLDHYLRTANACNLMIDPSRIPITLASSRAVDVAPEQAGSNEQAMAWFTAEYRSLLAAVELAAKAGFDVHAWELAWTLQSFLNWRGHWHSLRAIWHTGLEAAERLGDRSAQARARSYLGRASVWLDRFDDAHAHLQHALELYGSLGDRSGQAYTYRNLAFICGRQGQNTTALDYAHQARDLSAQVGNRSNEAEALNAIGWYHAQLGDHQLTLVYCGQALELFQEIDEASNAAGTWDSLGYAHHHLRQFQRAIDCYQRGLDLYREIDYRIGEAIILDHLGDTKHAVGDHDSARATWQRALVIFEELDHAGAGGVRAKLERGAPSD